MSCFPTVPIFGWSLRKRTTNSHLVKPTSFKPSESPMHHPEKWHAMQLFTQQKPIDQKVMKQYVASEISVEHVGRCSLKQCTKRITPYFCACCVVCFTPVWRLFQNKVRPPKTSCLLPLPARSVFIWSKFIEQISWIHPWHKTEISATRMAKWHIERPQVGGRGGW